MKCSELWLQEFIGASAWQEIQRANYPDLLTFGGLEVEERSSVAPPLSQVVVGEVVSCEKHPEATRLSVCKVKVDDTESLLTIVCGASNVRAGIRVPTALVGAVLPGDKHITKAKLRGVESHGMLCAGDELGLPETDGILILADDAPVGMPISDYLLLDDRILDLSITPNRGDCLSVLGIARELAALADVEFNAPEIEPISETITDTLPVEVQDTVGCPRYIGRMIKGIHPDAKTPFYMKTRLERSGIRSINPVVDVTNYVMLLLGQPMHAFDLAQLSGGIVVRKAQANEKLSLLDGSEVALEANTMVIADLQKPLAIAGVMGGLHSGISDTTRDIFLESAYFDAYTIAKQRQHYGLLSESSHRFERGVDFELQKKAIECATSLIVEICGGEVGPLIEQISADTLPLIEPILLSVKQVNDYLGLEISEKEIIAIFARLNMSVEKLGELLSVVPPSYRFDIRIPQDLIEEVARVHGYHHIPVRIPRGNLAVPVDSNRVPPLKEIAKEVLVNQGFHEVITYSFVDEKTQSLLNPGVVARHLANPIVTNMSVMRTNLWPGLVDTVLYNQSRQQKRTHFFEIGTTFSDRAEFTHLAGIMSGNLYDEQWGCADKEVDFFDLKGHVENLLSALCHADAIWFEKSDHLALHPGQQASIVVSGEVIGVMGKMHPRVAEHLDVSSPIYLFELFLNQISKFESKNKHNDVSKFPEVRRDIALLVDRTIPCAKIQDTIKSVAGDLLKEVFIFDVYAGDKIPLHLKSVAFAIILQSCERTLVDDEVIALIDKITASLKESYEAELRS